VGDSAAVARFSKANFDELGWGLGLGWKGQVEPRKFFFGGGHPALLKPRDYVECFTVGSTELLFFEKICSTSADCTTIRGIPWREKKRSSILFLKTIFGVHGLISHSLAFDRY
jgi:hypothetical protein